MEHLHWLIINTDDSVSVMAINPDFETTVEKEIAKWSPERQARVKSFRPHTPGTADRDFRAAWRDGLDKIAVDMPAARDIWRDKIRAARTEMFKTTDADFMIALQRGKPTEDIVAGAQVLRDMPADPRIEAATTPEELKAVTLEVLMGVAISKA